MTVPVQRPPREETTPVLTPVEFMALFPEFRASSWDAWRAVLARITPDVRELYVICGRGSGKSRMVSLLANYCGTARRYHCAPGERIYIGVFAPDRRQAGITFRYIVGLLRSEPTLAALIVNETRESIGLSTGVVIEVVTATTAAPRGRSYALAIIEEAAFLPQDQSANPDVELLRAVRPALARVPGSLLAVVTTAYARKGIAYDAAQKYAGQPDGRVVFVQADTLTFNPTFDRQSIETAYEEDPSSAAAEYGAQFRSDVETFVAREAIAAVVVAGRFELPPVASVTYHGFLDFAGGTPGGDSATLGIAHQEDRAGRAIAVLDLVREVRPPFSTTQVCEEFAGVLRTYGLTTATADHWAAGFSVAEMEKHGITVEMSAKTKSEIYRDLLPLINSGGCEWIEHPRLIAQLAGLERRTARGGRDSIDHAPRQHDDLVNSAAGALVHAGQPRETGFLVW